MGKTICFFSAMFFPSVGGVERYTYKLAEALREKGFNIVIVAANTHNMASYEKYHGMSVYRLPSFNFMKGRFPFIKYNREWKKVIGLLKKEKIDHIVVQTMLYTHAYYGCVFAKKNNIPVLVINHGSSHMSMNNKILDFGAKIYEHFLVSCYKRKCTSFYGVSLKCNEWLEHFSISAKGVIYNAIDPKEIEESMNSSIIDVRKEYLIEREKVIVLYAGRLVIKKGILKLMESVKKSNEKKTQFFLLIAGDGELYSTLKKANIKDVRLMGTVSHETVIALMQQSDIFCLPTEYPEGFPTSLLESAASGCFCITTNTGGAKELILNDEYGIVVKENTVEELQEKLEYAAKNKKYCEYAAIKARDRVNSFFTWESSAETLLRELNMQ